MIHSRFNPASTEPELLERTFVQREKLAERLVEVFAESALGESKHHVLLVGPRGTGKSHLAALIYHRLNARQELRDRLVIAYLREDEWGITSFLDLLLRILKAIGTETLDLTHWPPSHAEEQAWKMLQDRISGKTLLVILESLDRIFRDLGEEGQKKWRACIETYPCWAILATTPSLSADISTQAAPFYGFFEIHYLKGLSVSEGVALLRRLALSQGNPKIAAYVTSPAGRARVRAVQHLANGNHRIFVIFYDFLTEDGEQEVLEPLLKTIDTLTPYYQSQMKELSPQQRKLVEFLCEHRSPATVKTIATRCFVTQQTAASQLKQLLQARYVAVTRIGRGSYYELREPLLRVCVEAKSHTPEPVRLLVEFLRYWFSREELELQLGSQRPGSCRYMYLTAALNEYDTARGHSHLSPQVAELCAALTEAACTGDQPAVRRVAEELAQVSKIAEDWRHYTRGLFYLGNAARALPLILQRRQEAAKDPDMLEALAIAYEGGGEVEKALATVEAAIPLKPRAAGLWMHKGRILGELDRHQEAVAAYSQAQRFAAKWYPPTLEKGRALLRLGRHADAERLLKGLLKHGSRDCQVFVLFGCALAGTGKVSEALSYFEKATSNFPTYLPGWICRARALYGLRRWDEALAAIERAKQIDAKAPEVLHYYCRILFALGEYQRALQMFPVNVAAHQLFHTLQELDARTRDPRQIRAELLRWQSVLEGESGQAALLGGLVEFASYAWGAVSEVEPLRAWNQAISQVFKDRPRFTLLVKVFDVMARYRESGEQRILLELPLEQRRLLEKPPTSPGGFPGTST